MLGDCQEDIEAFEATLKTAREMLEALNGLGTTYLAVGRDADAPAQLRAALEIDPMDSELHGLVSKLNAASPLNTGAS